MPRNKNWRSNRSRKSPLHLKQLSQELHELLEIPRTVLHSKGGFRYEKPLKGQQILQAIVKSMVDALQRGESIKIPGFGRFSVETKTVKSGGTIRASASDGTIIGDTKVSIPHPPKPRVIFHPSDHLLAMVNLESPNVPNSKQRTAMKSWSVVSEN